MTYTLFLYIVICTLTISLPIGIVITIKSYKKKIKNIEEIVSLQKSPSMMGDDRIKYTNDLLLFIDNTITSELLNEKRFDIFLHQQNKNLDFDEVIKKVSSNTFNAIQKNIFMDENLMVTPEYLMRYIQKKTFITYFTYIQKNVSDQL